MSHDFRFHPSARDELDESIDYHESRRDGLGFELLFEVEATITLICESPTRWPLLAGMDPSLGVRRQVIHRFGFIVVYVVDSDDAVVIVAVAHRKREPGYWLDRVP